MGEEIEGVPSPTQVGGVIPHFFYDVIGRIVPGTFFILCCGVMFGVPEKLSFLKQLNNLPEKERTASYFGFLIVVSLLCVGTGGYLVGFLLGALSYLPCEKWRGFRFKFLDFPDLDFVNTFELSNEMFGDSEGIATAFEKRFGFTLDRDNYQAFQRQSWLCSYYVWFKNPSLGQMTSRWDAETLASRSLFFSATVLLAVRIGQELWFSIFAPWKMGFEFALFLALVSLAGSVMYRYERRRQLFGRFYLFCSVEARVRKTLDSRFE